MEIQCIIHLSCICSSHKLAQSSGLAFPQAKQQRHELRPSPCRMLHAIACACELAHIGTSLACYAARVEADTRAIKVCEQRVRASCVLGYRERVLWKAPICYIWQVEVVMRGNGVLDKNRMHARWEVLRHLDDWPSI